MSCGCSTPTPPAPTQPANTCGSCRQTVYLRRYPTGCGCGQPKPQCSCNEPETPLCVPCGCTTPECTPTYRAIRLHITIGPSDAGTCFPMAVCGCGDAAPDISKLSAKVRRRGQCAWLLSYPAWDCSDCGIEFRWDSLLYNLPKGRYELAFFYDGCECGSVEITISAKCPVNTGKSTPLKARTISYPTAAPPGAHPVFDQIASFTASLCGVFEKADTLLPLCPDDVARLCAITPCKPVRLTITDGYNTEVITYTGCTAGAPLVTRGEPRYRFPKGSKVEFRWVQENVQAVMSSCP